jgi:transcriptional regulator with XRE-family HTH domain
MLTVMPGLAAPTRVQSVRDRVLRLGVTQQQAAHKLGVSRSTIARVEGGEKVGPRVIRRLEVALDALDIGNIKESSGASEQPGGAAAKALHDLVVTATGAEPSAIVMELISSLRDLSFEEQARIVEAFGRGISFAESRKRG